MVQVIQSLLPIMLLIGLGAALLHFEFFTNAFRQGLDRFTYWIALPCLLVVSIADNDNGWGGAGRLTIVLVLATLGALLLSLVVAWAMRLSRVEIGTFAQAAFRGNLVFVGLPIILLAAGARGMSSPSETAGLAALALAPIVPLYNVLAVISLLTAQHRFELASLPKLFRPIITNPLIIACVLGLGLIGLDWDLPMAVQRSLALVGQTAAPLALVGLGAGLVAMRVGHAAGRATAASLVKVVAMPVITYPLCLAFGLDAQQTLVAMIFAACPTAVASYVLSIQLKGDGSLAAACVVISTVLSMGALAVVLYVI